ncbi:MAG: hypothetical protein M1426_06135, partial [Patescibacteria group bacterium]|nr:hypothetical protein [Patescibacteria group bacterium]
MWLLQLSFRNIFRNFRRSTLSFSAISIGLATIIFSIGFTRGFEQQAIRTVIHTRTGDIKIFAPGYWAKQDQNPLEYPLEKYQPIIEHLNKYPEVGGITPRIRFTGNLT